MKAEMFKPLSSMAIIYLLAVVALPTIHCFCPSSLAISHTSCELNYQFADTNCTKFQFIECSWTACSHYASQGSSNCEAYQTYTSTNWTTCTSVCCDSSKDYPYQANSIQQCLSDETPTITISLVAIMASVIGCLLLVSFFLLFCCCKERIYSKCECLRNCCEKITNCFYYLITCQCFGKGEQNYQIRNSDFNTTNLEFRVVQSVWSMQEIVNEKLNDICSICLDGRPTVELECHHVYHRQCILLCLKKKFECAMCRSKQIGKIKIFCQNCLCSFYEVPIKDYYSFLASVVQVCKNCKQLEEKKIEIKEQK